MICTQNPNPIELKTYEIIQIWISLLAKINKIIK